MTCAQPRRNRSGRRFPRADAPSKTPAPEPASSLMPQFVARGLREFDRLWRSQPQAGELPRAANVRSYGERRERCYVALRARDLAGSIGAEDDIDGHGTAALH